MSSARKRSPAGLRVGVVGATGMVGRILLEQLEKRRFPVGELRPFGSGRRDARVSFRGRSIPAPAVSPEAISSSDLVFLVSSDEVAKRWAEPLAKKGVWVIDDSSAFRLHPKVPLVIPEVNASALSQDCRLIAGPNCTVTGAAVAGLPIHRRARVVRVHMASYQAVLGAGREALFEFYAQTRKAGGSLPEGETLPRLGLPEAKALPRRIALNVFPQVGSFDEDGDCGEEAKVRAELRKIWSTPDLRVAVTTVRVPVPRGHSLALWLETRRPLSPTAAKALLRRAPGVRLWRDGDYPTPAAAAGTDPVHVGRIRRGGASDNELALWIVSDNLLVGAALNSVRIAEHLLKKGWLG